METVLHTLLGTFPLILPYPSLPLKWVYLMRILVRNGYIWIFLCSKVDQENYIQQIFGVPIPNLKAVLVTQSFLTSSLSIRSYCADESLRWVTVRSFRAIRAPKVSLSHAIASYFIKYLMDHLQETGPNQFKN